MKKITLLLFAALSTVLFSCNKNSGSISNEDLEIKNKVVILNQGNYTEQNSSIYVYDENTKTMTPNAYASANNGTKLGATLMSGTYSTSGVGFLLCANPDKIVVVDITTMAALTAPVTDKLSNCREIIGGSGCLFVTNAGKEYNVNPDGSYEYTKSYVSVYSASNLMHMQSIEVGSDAQGMAVLDNRVFVGTKDGIVILINEGNTLKIENVYKDEVYSGAVKYLCVVDEKVYASVPGYGVFVYDPYEGDTRNRYELPLDSNGYIYLGPDSNIYTCATIYNTSDWSVESSDVYQLETNSGNIKKIVSGEYLYSVGMSPYSKNLFVSEANGFTTNSTINIIDPEKGLVGNTTAGVGTFRYLFVSYIGMVDKN